MIAPRRDGNIESTADPLAGVSDRGVTQRLGRRDQAEALVEAASYFDRRDRALIEQVYGYGTPVSDLARLTGEPAARLRRRVKRLIARANGPLFGFLVLYADLIPQRARRTAELVVFRGYSLRRAAAVSGRSLYRVRMDLYEVRALARV